MTDALSQLLQEDFEYKMTRIYTAMPGVVVKYDYKTRRADIQPSIKSRLPDGSYTRLPIIPDVPVWYLGTKKYTIHIPLEKDDEALLIFSQRGTDNWRDKGGSDIEESDPRRFNLQDCFALPGLQPMAFITGAEQGLSIIHQTDWNGDFISSAVFDDDKIDLKYKRKCRALLEDDKITLNTEKSFLRLDGDKFSEKNHLQDLYTLLNDWLQENADAVQNGSPHTHKVSPPDKLKYAKLRQRLKQLMEAG
jgi:hypothetical protein